MLVDLLLTVYIISTGLSLLCNIGAYLYVRVTTLAGGKKKDLSRAKRMSLLNSLICLLGLSFVPGLNTWVGASYLKAVIKKHITRLLLRMLGE